jgi:hypothetical protein
MSCRNGANGEMRSVTDSILKRQCGEVFSKQQHDYTKTLVAATLRADVYHSEPGEEAGRLGDHAHPA